MIRLAAYHIALDEAQVIDGLEIHGRGGRGIASPLHRYVQTQAAFVVIEVGLSELKGRRQVIVTYCSLALVVSNDRVDRRRQIHQEGFICFEPGVAIDGYGYLLCCLARGKCSRSRSSHVVRARRRSVIRSRVLHGDSLAAGRRESNGKGRIHCSRIPFGNRYIVDRKCRLRVIVVDGADALIVRDGRIARS